MRTNRVLLAAAAAVTAFALTGCGGGGDGGDEAGKIPTAGDGSPSARTGKATAGGGKDEVAAYVEAKRAWVKCMRENGVDVPDPDANGQVELGDGAALKKNPTFLKASRTCTSLNPPVPAEIERRLAPKLTPEQIKTRFAYAECMQKNGAPDFPDPEADGNVYGDVQWDSTTAAAKRAVRTCAPIIGDPVQQGPGKG
ncbi:hypothetical protein [Streptomyces globisporus]|uniref:hypothetical protein n=1 Tax=Streptomyces globisporus TaxID=1908 RepID=UPI0004CAFE76|nr:hypothetical protein [Streptomyces globisporus]